MITFTKFDVVLGTIDEGTSGKRTIPGVLARCENATFPKGGRIDKRLGLAIVDTVAEADGTAIDPSNIFHNSVVAHGELLLIGHDSVYGLVDREGGVSGGALVRRGPTLRGNVEVIHVATAQISD